MIIVSRRHESLIVAICLVAVILLQFNIMGRAIIGLNIMLIITFFVWITRDDHRNPAPQKVLGIYLVGISVQCLHLCEEYLTNFQIHLPQLFGYKWSDSMFLSFNLVWLCIFILAAFGALHKIRIAYLIIWFYAIAGGIGNGIFHSALSLNRGGYFPGLITSFAHLIVGILLIRGLTSIGRNLSASS